MDIVCIIYIYIFILAKKRLMYARYFRLNMLPKGEIGLSVKLIKGDPKACGKYNLAENRRRLVVHQIAGPECRGMFAISTVPGE